MDDTCSTCGSPVEVESADEGTSYYVPDLEHVAYRYRPPGDVVGRPYEWKYVPASWSGKVIDLYERGWQVEKLHRRKEVANRGDGVRMDLRRMLERYGQHHPDCYYIGEDPTDGCNCGWQKRVEEYGLDVRLAEPPLERE